MFLVGAIATSVPAAASYCVGTTSSIVASEWAVSRGDSATIAHPARSSGLVTAVPAGNYRVAKFVCWQTLAVVASERTLGTFSSIVAADLILAARTIAVAVAYSGP